MVSYKEVPVSLLRKSCPTSVLKFKTTEELEPADNIIGQQRALDAIALGVDMPSKGYNIYIAGLTGTGRKTTVQSFLKTVPEQKKKFRDFCYVYNFQDEDTPTLLSLPPGQGVELKKDMELLTETVVKAIPEVLEGEDYSKNRKELINRFQAEEREIFDKFEKVLEDEGFGLVQISNRDTSKVRPEIAPMMTDGQPLPMQILEKQAKDGVVAKDKYKEFKKKYEALKVEMEKTMKKSRDLSRRLKQELENLNDDHMSPVIDDHVKDLSTKFEDEQVTEYLRGAKHHMVSNIERLRAPSAEKQEAGDGGEKEMQSKFMEMLFGGSKDPMLPYRVNVVVDNSCRDDDPVVIENFPSYKNLFGCIERVIDARGGAVVDFTKIKAGSLLKASGGYIVIDALDMLTEYGVWQTLKRIMKSGEVEIQNFDPWSFGGSLLKPEPIKIDVKIILIGSEYIYRLLQFYDEDFQKIFKIKADFDSWMPLDNDNAFMYARHIRKVTAEEGLLPFSKTGVARVVEHGIRVADHRNKLTTRLESIEDLVREASYWAGKAGKKSVDANSVEDSLDHKRKRLNLIEERLQEMISEGVILIDTDKPEVGQVNGLAVYDFGDYRFGKPSRITARASLGNSGVTNIEREAKMSGRSHDKGVLILSGFLKGRYAKEFPLSIDASIAFEQSYAGVDGDSASSTEAFALLSAISEIPLSQAIAVTGSMDQHGRIQPIGGVNDKIEGFFDVCNERGLTGKEGVIIPIQNVEDLMLRKDVIKAVKDKKFHIYPICSIDEGMEILTGKKAAEVNGAVHKKLKNMTDLMKDNGNGRKGKKKK